MSTNQSMQTQYPTAERKPEHTHVCERCRNSVAGRGLIFLGDAGGVGGCYACDGKGNTRKLNLVRGSGWVTHEAAQKELQRQRDARMRRAALATAASAELAAYAPASTVSLPE